MKLKKNKVFCSVLQKFDMEGLIIFIDTLDSTNTENHNVILSHICSRLDNLDSAYLNQPTTIKSVKRVISVARKYNPRTKLELLFQERLSLDTGETSETECSELSQGVRHSEAEYTDTHDTVTPKAQYSIAEYNRRYIFPIELYRVNRGPFNIYSQSYGITVLADENIIPEGDMNSFDLHLAVNGRSNRITLPDDYTGTYSALVSLECDPKIEMFLSDVMVTIPHCAIGDMDTLCVLSSHDGYELTEDPNIEIADIDKHYISFKTKHFSVFILSRSKCKKQSKRKNKLQVMSNSKSLDLPVQQLSVISLSRLQSCPAVVSSDYLPDGKFCAVLCIPKERSTSVLMFMMLVTRGLSSNMKVS